MKLNLPSWITRNVRIQLKGDQLNDVTFIIECGPFVITVTVTGAAFLQMLGEVSAEMGDEWAIVEHLLMMMMDRVVPTKPAKEEVPCT